MLMMLAMLACGEKSTEDTSVVGEPSTEDTNTEDTNTEDTNTEETDTQEEASGADALNVGDLVITEIMKNPCGLAGDLDGDGYVDCADPGVPDETGEWFEVHNASGAEINLNGLLVHEMDDGDSNTEEEQFVVTDDVIVAAGGYVVFGASADTSVNGGITVDVEYSNGAFKLGNGTDDIALSNTAGLLDSVMYNDDEFPDNKGYSLTLNPSMATAADNDSGANWCNASSALTSGDFGTPGAANDACQ